MGTYVRKVNAAQERSTLIIMDGHDDAVTLRLTGEGAKDGIELSALEMFVGHFVGALRGFDRVSRARPAVKGGHPERRAEAVSAFRVVELKRGSAVLTLKPAGASHDEEGHLFEEGDDPSLGNIGAMAAALAAGQPVDPAVADALEDARRALGRESGVIEITLPPRFSGSSVTLDRERIALSRAPQSAPSDTATISGWLHAVDFAPDKIGVRTPQGVEWTCTYPEDLEAQVKAVMDEVVVISGEGQLKSPRRGSLEIRDIRRASDYDQHALFSDERISLDDLQESQNVHAPQGLARMGDPEWEDDDAGERFFDYLLGRS